MTARKINQSMTLGEWAMLFALSVLWGGSYFFISVAVKELPPFTTVLARLTLATLALYAVARATGVSMPRGRRVWLSFLWLGFLNNVLPYTLYAWGQTHIGGSLASILNAATPLLTVVIAHYATLDEKMTGARLGGAVIGLGGVAAMIGTDALAGFDDSVLAQLACLAAAASYAFAGIYARRFAAMGITPLASSTAQLGASTVMLIPLALIFDQPWTLPAPSLAVISALTAQAVFSTALAFVLFFRLVATAGATNVALVTFLNPATAFILGAAFLGEVLQLRHFAGMMIIAIGFAFIDGRPIKAMARLLRPQPQ